MDDNIIFIRRRPIIVSGSYTANTVNMSGINGEMWMERDGAFWGADADQIYVSVWLAPGGTGTLRYVYGDITTGVEIYLDSSNHIRIQCFSGANVMLVDMTSTATLTRDGITWSHVFIRIDRTVDNQGEIYVNGTAGTTINTFLSTGENADPIDLANSDMAIGSVVGGTASNNYVGCMADFWMSSGNTYTNITIEDFYNAGEPVNLGDTGTGPDGGQPVLFLRGSGTGFTTNSGTGGNFIKKGTTPFTTCGGPP